MKIVAILVSLTLCCLSSSALSDRDYLITIPRVFRAGVPQKIGVNIFGNVSCDVRIRLFDPRKPAIHSAATGHFQPNRAGVLELQVPQGLSKPKVVATVCGLRTAEKSVSYKTPAKKIFIETDKPIYKPGQKVLIRVINVDNQLRPTGNTVSLVVIKEPNGAKIMQWRDVGLRDGIANLELQLSKEPVIGKWVIEATIEGITVTKQIEISKYVLPKFELDIKTPSYFAWDQREIPVSICARYTYGKFVTGRVKANLCLRSRRGDQNCLAEFRNVTGCLEIDARGLLGSLTAYKSEYYLHIDAKFTETSTGIKLKETFRSPKMVKHSKTMSFVGIPQQFKPGFPMKFKIKVSYLDGTPVTDGNVRVKITGDNNVQAFHKRYSVENGLVAIVFNHAQVEDVLNFKASYQPGNLAITKRTSSLYSPSFSYVKLVIPDRGLLEIGSQGSVKVMYNVVDNMIGKEIAFHYEIICKGNLRLSGLIKETSKRRRSKRQLMPRRFWRHKIRPRNIHKRRIKRIKRMANVNEFQLKFNVSQKMVPSCRILVYYVREDKEVVGDSIVYNVEDKLENQVSVDFLNKEKRPGAKTKIIVKAKPGSRVALAALDKSILLLGNAEGITKEDALGLLKQQDVGPMSAQEYNSKCNGRTPLEKDVSQAFNNAGLVIFSSLKIFTKPCRPRPVVRFRPFYFQYSVLRGGPRSMIAYKKRQQNPHVNKPKPTPIEKKRKRPKKLPLVKVRKNFPETWLWTEIKLNKTSEMEELEVQIPDTITSWVASAFGMSSAYGMGIANKAMLKVFQPFFVQMTLPYSVVRGEETPVTVTVFNYLSSCAPIKLELNRETEDYKITSFHISKMCVCGDHGSSVKFKIIPTKLGHIPLTVKAVTSQANLCPNSTVYAADAVTRKLLVEPEGIKQEYSKGSFFCSDEGDVYSEMIDLTLPKWIVPGSLVPKISVSGDVMGPALTNLDGLLAMPYGCGEQNMARFAPNIYIMDYLTNTNQVTTKIRNNAVHYMNSGYQRELRYKRKSGSYSAFGNRDAQGSMMLTAFVVRSYARARKYVFIDDDEIKHSIKWFGTKQKPSGCFLNYGRVFDRSLQGGLNSEITITAYVTIALLEAGFTKETTMVSKALRCVTNNLDQFHDSYTTSLVTYTLTLADHPKAELMIRRLKKKAITSKVAGEIFWSVKNGIPVSPADVEMTGYALMAYLKRTDLLINATKIVKWLSKQRNQFGGFLSTQDTCVALQALSEAAQMWFKRGSDTNLTVSATIGGVIQYFSVNDDNKLVLQRAELPNNLLPNVLAVYASGKGCALLQTSVNYNIPVPEEIQAFKVDVSVHRRQVTDEEEISACNPLQLKINVRWLKEGVSNMAIVNVKLVSGFSVNENLLEEKLSRSKDIIDFLVRNESNSEAILKRYEIDGQNVILYFDEIKSMTFSLDIFQSTLIKKTKPGVVKVYDYYEPANQAEVMYSITVEDCYGERIKQECPKCLSVEDFEAFFDEHINCTSYLMRVKSRDGVMNVKKAYIKADRTQNYAALSYEIPEFCPCDEIYSGVTSLVFGQGDYLRKKGRETTIVFDSATTVAKWNGKKMRKIFQEKMLHGIYRKCFISG